MADGGKKLSEEQIFEVLKSLNVPVKMNELKSPTREFIVRVFECFLKDLQIDINSPVLRSWEATGHIEEAELYEDSQQITLLVISVNHITSPYGLNLTIKDVAEPKPKRTKKILNYLIVFWTYYLRKVARFRSVEMSMQEMKKRVEELVLEDESLDEKCKDVCKMLEDVEPSKDELADVVSMKKEKLEKLKNQRDLIMSQYQELKTKEANLQNKISEITVNIASAKEKLDELSQLILTSPDRLSSEIQRMKDKLRAEELKIKEKKSKIKEKENSLESIKESQEINEKALFILQKIHEDLLTLCETAKIIALLEKEKEEEEIKCKQLQSELSCIEKNREIQTQKLAKLELNSKKRKETLCELLKVVQSDVTKETEAVESWKRSVAELKQEYEKDSNDILEMIKTYKKADDEVEERKAQHEELVKKTQEKFYSNCKQITDTVEKVFQM